MFWDVHVLSLVNDELEVDFYVGKLLHTHQARLSFGLVVLLEELLNRSVEHRFNVIYDFLKHSMMHPREYDYFKERLQGP